MKDHIYKYTITIKQQLILLTHVFFSNIAIITGTVYIFNESLNDKGFIITFLFFTFIDTIPTIVLHLQYWLRNHGAALTINTETKELCYEASDKQLSYSFTEIASLEYYRNLGKGSGWHSFGQYRYYKIIFFDKTELVITCLMINNIENTLPLFLKLQVEEHAKLLCLIE